MAASSGEEGSNCAEARAEAPQGQWQLRGGATRTHALLPRGSGTGESAARGYWN